MEFSENIASIYIDAVLSTKKLERQLLELEQRKFSIDFDIESKKVGDFRKSIERQFERCIPISFCVDDSSLNKFAQNLKNEKFDFPIEIDDRKILSGIREIKKELEGVKIQARLDMGNSIANLKKDLEQIKVNTTFTPQSTDINVKQFEVVGDKIAQSIRSKLGGNIFSNILSNTIGRVGIGAFESLGGNLVKGLTKDLNKGFISSIDKAITPSIGSFELIGEKIGDSLVDGIKSSIPLELRGVIEELGKELQADINEFLGEENISLEGYEKRRKLTKKDERKLKNVNEQIRVERIDEYRDSRGLKIRLGDNQELLNQNAKMQQKAEAYKSLVTKEASEKGYTSEINSTLKEISETLDILFLEEEELLKTQESLTKELEVVKAKLEKSKKIEKAVSPEILPNVYAQALKDVTGKFIDPKKAPKLITDDKTLKGIGANAAYSAESNAILISAEMEKAIKAGRLTFKQMETFYHEIQHAFDFDFGSVKGALANKMNVVLTKPIKPTQEELAKVAPRLAPYKPEERLAELNAHIAGLRKGGKAFELQEKGFSSASFIETFGLGGEKFKNVVEKQIQEFKDSIINISAFAKSKGLDISEDMQTYIAGFGELKQSFRTTSEEIEQVQQGQLGSEDIEKTSQNVENIFKDLELFGKKLRIFQLESVQKAKNLVKTPLVTEKIPELVTLENQGGDSPKASKSKRNVSSNLNLGISSATNENIIQEIERIKKDVLPAYSKLFKDLEKDFKNQRFDFIDENDLGGLAKAKTLLDAIKFAKEDIEKSRSNLGVAKIGSPEAQKYNQLLSQLKAIENKALRELNIAQNKLNKASTNQGDEEGIKKELNPLEVGKNLPKNQKQWLEEINRILKEASQNIENFDDLYASFGRGADEAFSEASKKVNGFNQDFDNLVSNFLRVDDVDFDISIFRKLDDSFEESKKQAQGFGGVIGGVFNNLEKYAFGFGGIFVLASFNEQIKEFILNSVEVAREMETINRQVSFSAGGGKQGRDTINSLRATAKELKLGIRETLQASSGFLASTEGTSLEGQIGLNSFQNFQKLFRAKGGSKDAQQRALLQLEQMAAIGQIQNVDLKQLSMAVPGVRGILARSQGLSPGELQKATRRGLGSDALIQFSQQAAIESESGIASSLDTLDAKIQGLDNSIFELQEKVGSIFLPTQKKSIDLMTLAVDFLTKNLESLLKVGLSIGVTLAFPIISPLVAQFLSLSKTIDFTKIKFKDFASSTIQALSPLKKYLASFLITEAIFTQIERLKISFSDLGGDISQASKSAKKDFEDLLGSLDNQKTNPSKLSNNPFDKFLKDLTSDPLKVLNPFDTRIQKESKELVDTQNAVKNILEISRELNKVSLLPKFNDDIQKINLIDRQIADVQAKRRGKVELSPQDSKGIQALQEQEQNLIQKRFEILKPVALLQSNLQKRIDDLKNSQKSLDELKDKGNISLDNYEKGSKAISEELAKLESRQTQINKAVGEAKNAFSLVRKEINSLNVELEDSRTKIELLTNQTKTSLGKQFLEGNLTKGGKDYLNQILEIQNAQKSLRSIENSINQKNVVFQSQDSQRILDAYSVNVNTGIAKINKLLENIENENDKFILEEFAKLQQSKIELSNAQLNVVNLQEQFKTQLIEQTKQVADYYRGIIRQTQETNLEFQKQLNSIKTTNAATKIRTAIGDTDDSFLNSFVDNLIGQIESISNIANAKLDSQSKSLQSKFQSEDALRAALDLKRNTFGNSKDLRIPVELDFSNIGNDENVRNLNSEFEGTNDLVSTINQGVESLDSLLQTNVNSTNTLSNSFNENLNLVQKFDGELANANNSTISLNSSIEQTSQEISKVSDSTNKTIESTNFLQQAWNGVTDWINQAFTSTQLWFNKLIESNDVLRNIRDTFNSIGSSINQGVESTQSFFENPLQGVKDFGKGIINQFGFSTEGQKLGIESPSTTQSLRKVLEGSVSQAQSFNASRPKRRGIHNGIDFDSTEGLSGHSLFNAIFPGKVLNLRQWGAGAARDRQGGEESNALRIESALPRNLGKFLVDYGHYEVPSAKVREGQFIGAGTTLGRLSGNDTMSNGGHLDLKIRIPSNIAQGFKNTRNAGNGLHFVDVKEFMSWYQRQIGDFKPNDKGGNPLVVPAQRVNASRIPTQVNAPLVSQRQSNNLGGGKYANKLNHLSPEFLKQVSIEAQKLGTKPEYLLAVMGFETGGTYSPAKTNSLGFTGLIQFSPKYSPGNIGKTTDQLRKMSQLEQLKYVVPYINKNRRGKDVSSLEQLYMSVLMPSAMGKGSNHSLPNWAYRANAGLDINKDGKISVAEATSKVRDYLPNQRTAQSLYRGSPQTRNLNTVANQGGFVSPNILQTQISQGSNIQQAQFKQQSRLNALQQEAEVKKQQQDFAKKQESQLNNLRRGLQENFDLRISTNRRTQDLKLNANPIKGANESFNESLLKINREYDDIILELSRKIQGTQKTISKSQQLLDSGDVQGENKKILETKIQDDKKTVSNLEQELGKVRKLRSEALNSAKTNFNFEESQRQKRIEFDSTSQNLDILKSQIEQLKTLQQTNPIDSRVLQIPALERYLSLQEVDLELQRQLSDLEDKKFKKEITESQFNAQAENLRLTNNQKKENIELTYAQVKAEQELRISALELEKRSRSLELDFSITQEKIRAIQNQKRVNPLVDLNNQELNLSRDLQTRQLGLESEKQLQSTLEFAQSMGLSADATQELIQKLETLNKIKLDNIGREFEQNLGEEKIKRLEDSNSRINRLGEFNNSRAFQKEQLEIDQYKNLGGNEFVANSRSRLLGRNQEFIRFEKEKRELDIEVLRMQQSGINVDDSWLSKVREDMDAIHNLNLENINFQFKTFGQTLNEIGSQALKGLSSGITDLLMGTRSLSDVLDNFFNNILSQVLNVGLNSLLGGLLGGGFNLFYAGGIVPNYAKGSIHPSALDKAFHKERLMSGRKPQLAVVHENELIIPAQRVEALQKQGLSPKMLLGNFANGGIVGNKSISDRASGNSSSSREIKVEMVRINDINYVTEDQLKIAMQEAANQGGELGEKRVQSKLANSVSFRSSVGIR